MTDDNRWNNEGMSAAEVRALSDFLEAEWPHVRPREYPFREVYDGNPNRAVAHAKHILQVQIPEMMATDGEAATLYCSGQVRGILWMLGRYNAETTWADLESYA